MLDLVLNFYIKAFELNPIGQIIGFIAFILVIVSFLNKKDKFFYLLLLISQIVWVVHFLLIGLYSGAIVDFIGIGRSYVALKHKSSKNILYIIFVFIFLYISFYLFMFWGNLSLISVLPIIAGILGTYAVLYYSGLKGRLLLLPCSFLWLIYSFHGQSIGGIVTEIFVISSSLITIFRLKLEKK